ncbi:MAG: hypothetical protein AAFY88_16330, partial [Acidobacteriota bacterium]
RIFGDNRHGHEVVLDRRRLRRPFESGGVLGIGYLLPAFYLVASLKKGRVAGPNPWGAAGLEWTTQSPPIQHNFVSMPVVTEDPYQYPVRQPADAVGASSSDPSPSATSA